MNRPCMASVAAVLILSGSMARAAPPTVVPSPGYDARLQEQHKALSSTPNVTKPINPAVTPTVRHHTKRRH